MILDTNRERQPLKGWRSLLLPVVLIGLTAGMLSAAAGGHPPIQVGGVPPAARDEVPSASFGARQTRAPATIDPNTIWMDTVKWGNMNLQVRGLGVLLPAGGGRLMAELQIAETNARHVQAGQPVSVDIQRVIFPGTVFSVGSATNGTVAVEVALESELLTALKPGVKVEGTIQFGRLDNVLYLGRPVRCQPDSTGSLFKLDADGKTLVRTQVRFGKSSVNTIEIVDGLKVGDKVILSDMSDFDGADKIRLP